MRVIENEINENIIFLLFFAWIFGARNMFRHRWQDVANRLAATTVSSTLQGAGISSRRYADYKQEIPKNHIWHRKSNLQARLNPSRKLKPPRWSRAIKQHAVALIAHQNAMNYSEASKSVTPCEDQEKAIGDNKGYCKSENNRREDNL